jgi:hypothetical protein
MTPSTPLEERGKRENIVKIMVESINILEVECAQIYTKNMGV